MGAKLNPWDFLTDKTLIQIVNHTCRCLCSACSWITILILASFSASSLARFSSASCTASRIRSSSSSSFCLSWAASFSRIASNWRCFSLLKNIKTFTLASTVFYLNLHILLFKWYIQCTFAYYKNSGPRQAYKYKTEKFYHFHYHVFSLKIPREIFITKNTESIFYQWNDIFYCCAVKCQLTNEAVSPSQHEAASSFSLLQQTHGILHLPPTVTRISLLLYRSMKNPGTIFWPN